MGSDKAEKDRQALDGHCAWPLGGKGAIAGAKVMWKIASIDNGAPGYTLETEGANSRLMAAAPELLAALERIAAHDPETCDGLTPRDCVDTMREIARAAVAKSREPK